MSAAESGRLGGLAGVGDAKRRDIRGERNPFARLTERQVVMIRELHARGYQSPHLAERYGVCTATISAAIERRSWAHVGGEGLSDITPSA